MARLHTITEFAVAMWNSAPRMHRRAADLGVDLLPFQGQEMGDLLAYLFEKRDLDERGDAGRGARIYQARGCAACHDNGQDGSSSLMPSRRRLPPFLLISALWKHGSQTAAELKRRGRTWPSLDHRDMADLVAYLNR
jgi:mono/diheme cytochrome c family protein